MGKSHQAGWVVLRGKKWYGYFRRRVLDPQTEQERADTICIRLGLKLQMTKFEAGEALRAEINKQTGQNSSERPPTMATRAQRMGSVKDIQAHLRHSKADTTANEYMQELPGSVKQMVGSVFSMLTEKGSSQKVSANLLPNATKRRGEEVASY